MPIVDQWTIFDNTGTERRIVAESTTHSDNVIYDNDFFHYLEKESRHGN